VISSAGQKGFVRETGCFNNVHILKEIIRSSKGRSGPTAIQLDITKVFDTNGDIIPSSAAESTLCYAGGLVSPWSGLQHRDLVDQVEATFERIWRAELKPHQTFTLISTHTLLQGQSAGSVMGIEVK
jgi:hypothetical protein